MLRLFVALEVNEAIRGRLAIAIDACRPVAPKAKWDLPEKLHVTVAFLGSVDEAKVAEMCAALDSACARHAPLELTVGGGGTFGAPSHPKVLWAAVGGATESLARLYGDLADALAPFGYEKEARGFQPHVTLARARELRGDRELAECRTSLMTVESMPLHVNELVLMRSTAGEGGSKYDVVHRAPLGAGVRTG